MTSVKCLSAFSRSWILRADAVVGERDLRDQDHVGAAGDSGVEGNPARVAAHDLQHHHAVVALGRGVQAVEGVGGAGHGRVEPEGHHGAFQVVVDGLGHAHQGDAALEQLLADAQRAVAADAHQAANVRASACRPSRRRSAPGAGCRVSPWPTFAEKRPRLAVPRIVPPRVSSAAQLLIVERACTAAARGCPRSRRGSRWSPSLAWRPLWPPRGSPRSARAIAAAGHDADAFAHRIPLFELTRIAEETTDG